MFDWKQLNGKLTVIILLRDGGQIIKATDLDERGSKGKDAVSYVEMHEQGASLSYLQIYQIFYVFS